MEGANAVIAPSAAAQILSLTLRGRLPHDPDHTDQIAFLKKEIQQKNEEISRLNEDVKELREQNDEFKITVESKNKEIKNLRDKIDRLEAEKKVLETKLRAVEVELDAVRKEVVEMKETNKIHEEKNSTLEVDVEKLSKKMDAVKNENRSLSKELKELREEVHRKAPLRVSEGMALPFLTDPVEGASLVLGELCWQIQAMMYKNVLPNLYKDRRSYKVKHIEEDLKELEDEQQKEAWRKWDDLKTKLKWNKRIHNRAMKTIQDGRNMAAHPEIDEQLLRTSADLMEKAGKLTDWQSPDCVKELIEMWKTLKQQQ